MKKTYTFILILIALKIATATLGAKLQFDKIIIDEIIDSELKRKNVNLSLKVSSLLKYSKIKKETSLQMKNVIKGLRSIEKAENNYDRLKAYIEELKQELKCLQNFKPNNLDNFPKAIQYYKLKEQLIIYLDSYFIALAGNKKYEHFKRVQPIITDIKYTDTNSAKLKIQPFVNIEIDSNVQIFIKNKKIKVSNLPFYYQGNLRDVRCEIQHPYTKEKRIYEGQ